MKVPLSDVLIDQSTRGRLEALAQELGEDIGQVITRLVDERVGSRRLTPAELGGLGERLAAATDPHEVEGLTQRMVRGFYGR